MTDENAYHYHVVRRAIDLIDETPGLSLEALAEKLSMSPAHLQRVFSAWAGVSPKRYQQYLTLDHARRLLAEKHTVIETAAETGLSGGGRLHDLFLRWEAMTPGEYARAGEGLVIREGWFDSPFGPMLVAATDRGICGLGFGSEIAPEAAEDDLHRRWPKADFRRDARSLEGLVQPILGGMGETRLHLMGSSLQLKVWEALLAIPSGHVTTYSDLAVAVGNPRAVRAVGTAVGRNPVSWLIPCHRALRKSGGLGGYHWGLPVKRALLAWEALAEESDAA